MKAAPSGCCMMLHTSSTTSSLGRGSWAAAAHTVSVQTIAAAGLQLRLQQVQVEDRHQGLAGQQVVALVGEQVPQAAGGEGPQQVGDLRGFPFQVAVEVPEAGALPPFGVVTGQGMVQGGTALGAEAFPHHHLDQTPQAADALQQFLAVAPVDDKGVHALAGNARRQHAPAGGAGHVGVLALGVDDVCPDAATQPPQHAQLGGETLAAAGAG